MIVIPDGRDPVQVRTGDEPFQLCVMACFLAWAVVSLAALPQVSGSSARILPAWGVYAFFSCLAAGCAATLCGVGIVRFRESLIGLEIERVGLTVLIGLLVGYSVWTYAATGARAVGFVIIMAAVWGAAALRVREITADLRKIERGGRP